MLYSSENCSSVLKRPELLEGSSQKSERSKVLFRAGWGIKLGSWLHVSQTSPESSLNIVPASVILVVKNDYVCTQVVLEEVKARRVEWALDHSRR